MNSVKWISVLVALLVFAGCEKSDEQKLQDAAEDAQKDAAEAVKGIKLPSAK